VTILQKAAALCRLGHRCNRNCSEAARKLQTSAAFVAVQALYQEQKLPWFNSFQPRKSILLPESIDIQDDSSIIKPRQHPKGSRTDAQ
jgi:hypothetical protein